MHHIPPLWTSFSNCTATSPAVLHHRLPDHFQHTTVHQHHWFIGVLKLWRHNTTSSISHWQDGSGLRTAHFEAINTAVLTTPERSSLSLQSCLFTESSCPSDFLSSASDTCAHTHVCSSSCRTSADYVLLILELLYNEDQFTADRDHYLPCPVSRSR